MIDTVKSRLAQIKCHNTLRYLTAVPVSSVVDGVISKYISGCGGVERPSTQKTRKDEKSRVLESHRPCQPAVVESLTPNVVGDAVLGRHGLPLLLLAMLNWRSVVVTVARKHGFGIERLIEGFVCNLSVIGTLKK